MKRNRIVIGALLGLFLVASMPQVSFAQEEIGGQKFYVEGTRWTELRLDTTKYDSWFTGNLATQGRAAGHADLSVS